jgi:hypothetical protein
MLTIPTIIGIIWVMISFVCLFLAPFVVLISRVIRMKREGFNKKKLFELVLIQILIWVVVLFFIHLIFGGFWTFFGMFGGTFSNI